MDRKITGLKDAYALETPDDSRELYAGWAETYDGDFAAEMDYQLPALTANAFAEAQGTGPVLDVGAGTGLVAQCLLHHGITAIDGTDISPEMLEVARGKGLYRGLFISDITQAMDVATGTYSGVISAGTFTLGHVGPNAFDELLRIGASGALFTIAINAEHYEAAGFADKLESMSTQITDFELLPVQIYGVAATGGHADDVGLIARFRKA